MSQKQILEDYCKRNGIRNYRFFTDDGISGTTFDRPGFQEMEEMIEAGEIGTVIVKDLSRFGRDHVFSGYYTQMKYPSLGVNFIAIQDNVDIEKGTGVEMMPIQNVFNEWHAANTSKKVRAVRRAFAKEGVYIAKKASYGYKMGTDKKHTPIIDEEVAPIVRRIFEMYASGLSPSKICETLNLEGIPTPAIYASIKLGQKPKQKVMGFWSPITIREMLNKIIYLGHLPQLCWTSVSYKNHKKYRTDESEWQIVYNNHEPIISQELWDRVQERKKSVATGRKTKIGFTHPLSGFLFCADCGNKMKLCSTLRRNGKRFFHFDCGHHIRYGKAYCFSHYIAASILDEIVLEDIREMARRVTLDEKAIREEFIRHNTELADNAVKSVKKELQAKRKRTEEISRLIQVAYEDRVKGKMPEDICLSFIQKYSDEQKKLETEIAELEAKLTETENTMQSADDFIRSIKKYFDAPELTREMCYELIDRIVVGSAPKTEGEDRVIDIIYKVDIASVLRYKLKK